ncbi:tetratricopeptide repeat protein [Stenotrophomonas sp. GbtcB23]|uniref:tetratricopeptide repeat protein n=1 Tax=Stenotrophomonas sp. GbtcB23 TaxID=2824768 RepID=UPI001C310563|nr:tetratricopeptide repeat protein [Stenotrophomonas sp. GbtcB23]
MNTLLSHVHLARPALLWALAALPLIALLWTWRRRRSSVWRQNVDAHLLPHLLVAGGRRAWSGLALLLLGWTLAVVALAGPGWRQLPQPLWQAPAPLVVALDLSSRTTATDLPPSRLLQARAKLATLLRERSGGEVALLAYADDAFTVAPLTGDAANVALYLDALAPDVMPRDGQRADRAIEAAVLLLQQSGAKGGDILLLTDRADDAARAAAAAAKAQNIHVSVLGLGTAAGAAYRSGDGQIARAQLEPDTLRAVADAGGGRYAPVADDEGDLKALGVLTPRASAGEQQRREGEGLAWRDEGFWLLPPLMLLSLWAFRRRGVAAVALVCVMLPLAMPAPAQAAERNWWQRADQRDQQRVAEGVEAYRRGDFQAAQQQFEGVNDAEARYNLGNALARQGQYDAAIAAYDQALALRPGMPDAVANRAAVDAARKRKPPPGAGQQPQQQQQKQNQSQQSQQQQQQQKQDPSPKGEQGQPKPGQGTPPQDPQAGKPDPGEQARADAAQRERMRQALEKQQADAGNTPAQRREANETPQQREQRQAVEAWMRRVPDEPGNLLRQKFQLESERRKRDGQ